MKTKKLFIFVMIAILFSIIAYGIADESLNQQIAFEVVVNNTNLAPTFPGDAVGTGERFVENNTYYANNSAIQLMFLLHANTASQTANIILNINDTNVSMYALRPLANPESTAQSTTAIIPKGASYKIFATNFHHYEWREYPILSGKNGTLSINTTVSDAQLNLKLNRTGTDSMTGHFNIDGTFRSPVDLLSHYMQLNFSKNGISGEGTTGFGNPVVKWLSSYSQFTLYTIVSMDNNNIIDVADPIDLQDAATKNYVDTSKYNLSSVPSSVLSFDGINDFVMLPLNITPVNNYSITIWVNPTIKASGYFYGTNINGRTYIQSSATKLQAVVGNPVTTLPDIVYDINSWYNIVLTSQYINSTNNTAKFYVNGVFIGEKNYNSSTWTNYNTYIGRWSTTYSNSSIDEVRIWDRALSASEIANLYNNTYVNSSGLILNMKMNEGYGTTTYDESGYDNHGTLVGANWSSSYLPLQKINRMFYNSSGLLMRE